MKILQLHSENCKQSRFSKVIKDRRAWHGLVCNGPSFSCWSCLDCRNQIRAKSGESEKMIYFPVRLFVRNDWKISWFPSKIRILRWFTVTADWTRVLLPSCGLTRETVNSSMFIYIFNVLKPPLAWTGLMGWAICVNRKSAYLPPTS